MAARINVGAAAPGPVTPTSDNARRLPGVIVEQQGTQDRADSRIERPSREACRVIEGERAAHDYLARLQGLQADPDELAVVVSMLYGAALRGFCRVIEKALQVARQRSAVMTAPAMTHEEAVCAVREYAARVGAYMVEHDDGTVTVADVDAEQLSLTTPSLLHAAMLIGTLLGLRLARTNDDARDALLNAEAEGGVQ